VPDLRPGDRQPVVARDDAAGEARIRGGGERRVDVVAETFQS
jgi:hypothetical protein